MKHLILASSACQTAEEQRILKLATWMGVPTKTISIDHQSALTCNSLAECYGNRCCLVMSNETLALTLKASPVRLENLVQERCAQLLIFGCADPTRDSSLLSWLTRGAVRGISSHTHGQNGQSLYELPYGGRDVSGQLAGLSFSSGRNVSVPTFDESANDASAKAIMLVNRKPVFIRISTASCEIFLLAGREVPDIDEALSPGNEIEAYYDQLIPFLVFVRHCFGKACWHSPTSTAQLIIDDPLLADRYGFLDYRTLLSSMRREGYRSSVAFIPWNYHRTSSHIVSNLLGGRSELSICVHGCDHINGEFDVADEALLEWKARLAIERMERHQARTGLPFERVMVFPQGRFSSDAMRALRVTNYLAAANSTCFPTDERAGPLTIADFLRPAITRFHGFPIFQRRYPRRLIDSAFDMFIGKPVLLVEHHQYFRDQCEKMEAFVAALGNLEPTLTWPTLSDQFMRSCIMRSVSPDSVEVQFFTRRFRLDNANSDRRRFRLTKQEPDSSAIRCVLVDGISVPFSVSNDFVEVQLEADPGQTRNIEIIDHPTPSLRTRPMGWVYNARVFTRRGLSEFRDNTLATHPRLLQIATGLATSLRLTANRHRGS